MNLDSEDARLVLVCPAWKKWGEAKTVKPETLILHSRADDVVPFEDSVELLVNSGLRRSPRFRSGASMRPPCLGAASSHRQAEGELWESRAEARSARVGAV